MKVNVKKLIELVEKGVPAQQIKKELGIKTRAPLKAMYYKALVKSGKVKDIMTKRKTRRGAPRRRALTIGKRGTILLSKVLLVDRLGFKQGDKFTCAKRKDGIILTKI